MGEEGLASRSVRDGFDNEFGFADRWLIGFSRFGGRSVRWKLGDTIGWEFS
jgi:hypothetical protein